MKDEFKTSDTTLSAILLTLGYPLYNTQFEGKQLFYIFDRTPDLEQALQDCSAGTVRIEPFAFQNNYKRLRSMTMSSASTK